MNAYRKGTTSISDNFPDYPPSRFRHNTVLLHCTPSCLSRVPFVYVQVTSPTHSTQIHTDLGNCHIALLRVIIVKNAPTRLHIRSVESKEKYLVILLGMAS